MDLLNILVLILLSFVILFIKLDKIMRISNDNITLLILIVIWVIGMYSFESNEKFEILKRNKNFYTIFSIIEICYFALLVVIRRKFIYPKKKEGSN